MFKMLKNKHAEMEQVSMEERDFHLRAENGLVFTICRIKRVSVRLFLLQLMLNTFKHKIHDTAK